MYKLITIDGEIISDNHKHYIDAVKFAIVYCRCHMVPYIYIITGDIKIKVNNGGVL